VGNADDPRRLITTVLAENDGNILRTAHDLGIDRSTLYDYVERLSLWPVVNRLRRNAVARRRN
jgi:transcriptional regulator of acetoin/glycerol metabolism